MKKKLGMFIAVLAIASLLVCLLALAAFAEDETITVTYNWHGGSVRGTIKPNEDGSYTLRSEKLSGDSTATLTDGTVVSRELYGWYDEAGNLYEPGATVYFDKSTMIYEAYGITVYNADDLKKFAGNYYVRLGTDITLTKAFDADWSTTVIGLNGYTLTCTAGNVASIRRSSFVVHGPGKLIHEPETLKTGIDESAVYIYAHGYGDDDAPQQFWVGKDVEFTTPYSAFRCGSTARNKHPKIAIAGTVNARALARISATPTESTCMIYDSAKITTTESFIEFPNQSSISTYMYLTLDGTINVANGNGTIFTDFVLQRVETEINGGKYCVSESDRENLVYYMKDTQMLAERVEDELTWVEVVDSDCEHAWVKIEEKSVDPTLTSLGQDFFECELCHREKTIVTAYNPSNSDVSITVRDEDGNETDVTVKAGDVLNIVEAGVGENTSYSITGVKDSQDYAAESIVAIEIPRGVGAINMTSANSTLETINIGDGVDLGILSLAGLTGIKTINVGAATITVSSIGSNTTLESFNSNVAGANITFKNNCFDGKSSLKYLTMSDDSYYSFGANSFRQTGIETLIFPDKATIKFAGEAAFYNAAVKYAYFGDSITQITNKPLDCTYNLELLVIKAATYVDQYCFCVNGESLATAVLKVYCHSNTVSLNGNTFINRMNYGVELYTIDPNIKSLANCTYTVYNGIPHAYEEGIVLAPTCISTGIAGSTTDCPCGVNEVVTYTVYTADGSQELSTAQREIPVSDIHVLGGALFAINYPNGYGAQGVREYYCGICGVATLEDANDVAAPLFDCVGYSVPENGGNSIAIGYFVNKEIEAEISAIEGTALKYGVFAVSQTKLGDGDLFTENGGFAEGVLYAYTSSQGFAMFELKVKGFVTDAQKAAKLAIGAFVVLTQGEDVTCSCVQGGAAAQGEKYYFASYNEMVAITE